LALVFTVLLGTFPLVNAAISDGTVDSFQKISEIEGGFGQLNTFDFFGKSVASIGDLDGDGIVDFAVGAHGDDDGCLDDDNYCSKGAVYILFMNNDGTVKSQQKISDDAGGFTGNLDAADYFGYSMGGKIGDFDGDGIPDLIVSAFLDDDGGTDKGALYILFLNSDGTVKSHQKISDTEGGFTGGLDNSDSFGHSVSQIGDLNGDGIMDLAVGAEGDDDGGVNRGAVWILFLNSDGTVKSHQKISDTEGGFEGILFNGIKFGHGVHPIGDLDVDGVVDLVVGSEYGKGAIWILFLNSDGTVKSFQEISDTEGGFTGALDENDHFGVTVDGIGDLDNDGIPDLAVGADLDDDGGTNTGALYILFLNSDGTVKSHQKISDTEGGLEGILNSQGNFGHRVVRLDDHNGDGVVDLFVGAHRTADGGSDKGAVWILFLKKIEDDDGKDTIGLHKSSNSQFILFDGFPGNRIHKFPKGGSAHSPLVGDWNGDGQDTIGLHKSSNSQFILFDGFPGNRIHKFTLGLAGDIPLIGDWNDNGMDTVGLYGPSTNQFILYDGFPGNQIHKFAKGGIQHTPLIGDWQK